ncbi:hypothetical protein GYMLUDRAFT_244021 [Collybiopsis luxurians FD-317 M1]|uniref:MYND-type domain-containing protein n=1 Tax=Collybiopsis luxurians FD-317 M1 TaxID=944289 RepID=A0A0D0CXB9_9AGAR|nr:hypothetical protein GYMLUDRAFT_244021 [Collybiopsis luxurians FD-317 M1]
MTGLTEYRHVDYIDPTFQNPTIALSAEDTVALPSAITVPPFPPHRHPAFVNGEPLHRQPSQYSQYNVSSSASKPLKKCSAYLIVKYCSCNCQKKDWPFHKQMCECNRGNQASWFLECHIAVEALRKFIAKNRPTTAEAAFEAFKLRSRPQQALHDVLVLYVSDRRRLFPGICIHRETFYVTEIKIVKIAAGGPISRDLVQDQVVRVNTVNARMKGKRGLIFAIITCGELGITEIQLVDSDNNVWEIEDVGDRWKSKLVALMNEGTVV